METAEDFASQTVKEEPSSPVAMETSSMNEDNPSFEVKNEMEETPQEDSTICQGVPPRFTEEMKTEELDLPALYKEEEQTFPCYYPSKLALKSECNFDHEHRTDDNKSSVYIDDPRLVGKTLINKLNTKAFVLLGKRIDHFQGESIVIERNLQQSQSPLIKEQHQSGRLETQTVNKSIIGSNNGASDTADLYKIPQMRRFGNKISKSFVQLGQRIDQPGEDIKVRKLKNGSNLKQGILVPTNKKPTKNKILFSCKHCMKLFLRRSKMELHQLTHTVERPYSCIHYMKSYSSKTNLKRHLRVHTGKRYSCEHCKKSFSSKDYLKVHQRSHTGEKPYGCGHCNKSFPLKSNLMKHIRTHTNERPYRCQLCKKSFSQKCTLVTHIRTHTKERPYSCNQCSNSFSDYSNLLAHIRTHTNERRYCCDLCNKSFTQKITLVRHIRTHTNERPYSCKHCGKPFSRNDRLRMHLQTHADQKR